MHALDIFNIVLASLNIAIALGKKKNFHGALGWGCYLLTYVCFAIK